MARVAERAVRSVVRRGMLEVRAAALRLVHRPAFEETEVDPQAVHRILSVRLDRLGDLVLTLPAIDALAETFPNAHRMVMVRPAFAPLLRGRPSVHRVIVAEHHADVHALALEVASCQPDLAVDFSAVDDLGAARALALADIPARVGLAGGGREVYFTKTAEIETPCSASDLGGLLVEAAGGDAPHVAPTLNVSAEAGREAEGLLRQLGASPDWLRIAVHPGGHYPTQRWPVDRFADVAVALAASKHGKVVILSGPGEDELVRALYHYTAEHAVIVPPVDVASLAAVMSRCDLLLANNSGPLHLAGAVGLKTVSVMGPSDPVRFHPMGRVQTVLRRENLPCSPCSRGTCGPHDCLQGIGASEVLEAAQEILDTSRSRQRLESLWAPLESLGAGA